MPQSLALPEINIGAIVSGNVVLRDVVINTVPSPRANSGSPLYPAYPLDYDGRTGGQIGRPSPIMKPSPPQYADLMIPQNLPADAFSVLIDKRDNSIVKANPQETAQFLQQDFYFIGSFSSATADAVIKDMLDNPMPSLASLLENYTTAQMKLYMMAYATGLVMYNARVNAMEGWGNFVSFQDRINDANTASYEIPVFSKITYPKAPQITFSVINSDGQPDNSDPRRLAGQTDTANAVAKLTSLIFTRLDIPVDQRFSSVRNTSTGIETSLGYIVKDPQMGKTVVAVVNEFSSDEMNNWGARRIFLPAVTFISDPNISQVQAGQLPPRKLPPALELATEYNLAPNIDPAYAELTLKYLDLQKQLAEIIDKGEDLEITDSQPFTAEELVSLESEGLAEIVKVVNPNPSATINANDVMLYEYIEVNYSNGTSTSTWRSVGRKSDFQIKRQGKEYSIDGKEYDIVITTTGKKYYILTGMAEFPSIQPLPSVAKATVNSSSQYNQIYAEIKKVGEKLGAPSMPLQGQPTLPPSLVPAGCTPQTAPIPPQRVPSGCIPIRIRDPIIQTKPSVQVLPQPQPPANNGGGYGSMDDQGNKLFMHKDGRLLTYDQIVAEIPKDVINSTDATKAWLLNNIKPYDKPPEIIDDTGFKPPDQTDPLIAKNEGFVINPATGLMGRIGDGKLYQITGKNPDGSYSYKAL